MTIVAAALLSIRALVAIGAPMLFVSVFTGLLCWFSPGCPSDFDEEI